MSRNYLCGPHCEWCGGCGDPEPTDQREPDDDEIDSEEPSDWEQKNEPKFRDYIDIKKKADGGASTTAPLYVTDDGHEFTVADLVTKKFDLRGRKYKAKSLASRIMKDPKKK